MDNWLFIVLLGDHNAAGDNGGGGTPSNTIITEGSDPIITETGDTMVTE